MTSEHSRESDALPGNPDRFHSPHHDHDAQESLRRSAAHENLRRASQPSHEPRPPSYFEARAAFGASDEGDSPVFDAHGSMPERTARASENSESTPGGAPLEPGARPKRRRGTRGGRRRRGARKSDAIAIDGAQLDGGGASELADDSAEVVTHEAEQHGQHQDPLARGASPAEGDAPRTSRRKRRGRGRGRGAQSDRNREGGTADRAREDGPVEPLLPDEDDFVPRPNAAVPRELDALPEFEGRFEDEPQSESDAGGETPAFDRPNAPDDGTRKKRRRRGTRGGRRRKQQLSDGRIERASPVVASAHSHSNAAQPAEVEAIPGEDDDLPALPELPLEAELLEIDSVQPARAGEGRGRSRRKKRGEKNQVARVENDDDLDEEMPAIPEAQRTTLILVNATDPEEHRVAVVEDERIVDFQMTVKDQDSLVNDIYRGRVVNLEPAIGAAFIDFGQGRNGFLHTSDVLSIYGDKDWSLDKLLSAQIDPDEWDAGSSQPSVGVELADDDEAPKKDDKKHRRPKGEHKQRFRARPRLPITDLLKKGQMVVVQVTKDAIGDKGPTLTTYISIPGRYLVLMPSMSRTGVSRKIEDEKERKRLKRILQSLEVPDGMGVIVRTAGVGHSKAEIKRDLDYLKSAWDAFGNRLSAGHGPAPLYRESDVAIRTMRDLFTPTTKAVIVDDPEVHRHITEFTEKLMPENVERVKLHSGARPLFQSYGIEPDFEKIFSRRIELPSGGSVVFDSAEALVAIDVNSGRTRSDGFDFEEIALKTNLEAVPEIARQIRLRDLGGIIVCDFIDMMKMGNIRTVERAFARELENDRARSKIGRISQFGLLELTRQRLGPGIAKKAFHSCPRCRGTGRIRTVNSRAAAILRRLGSAMILKGFSTVEVRAHPEVVEYMRDSCSEYIRALEYRFSREVKLIDAPEQQEDSILRYLRTDGREVRPGGRRKR